MSDVRTVGHIMSDLLDVAIENEWSAEVGYHGDPVSGCPSCDVSKYANRYDPRNRERNPHKPDCKLAALISEARAYLRAENALAEARGDADGLVYFDE